MRLTVIISLFAALISGWVLFSQGNAAGWGLLDVIFGLSVAVFLGSLVSLIGRHAIARLPNAHGDKNHDRRR